MGSKVYTRDVCSSDRTAKKLPLRSIDEHCFELTNLIIHGLDINEECWLNPLSMLQLASGIVDIRYDRYRFDSSAWMCEAADEFIRDQDTLERKLALSLSRFGFIWSAVESFIELIIPKRLINQPRGKINNACFYLKGATPKRHAFQAYVKMLNTLKELAADNNYYGGLIEACKIGKHVSSSGEGLLLTYRLRNKLAHGALGIPITKQEEELHLDNRIVECCSRLILYTIQMIILHEFENHVSTVLWRGGNIDFGLIATNLQYSDSFLDSHIQEVFKF